MTYRVLLLSLAAVGVFAQPAAADGFSGFYAGAQIGAARSDTDVRVTTPTARASRGSDSTALAGGVFAGYGATVADFIYLGGEVSLGADGAKSKRQTLAGVVTQDESGLTLGVSGRVGAVIGEDSLIYGRIGAENRRSEFTTPAGRKDKTNVNGVVYGIGYERLFGDSVSGRVELSRVDYRDKSFAGTGAAAGVRTTYDPSQTRLMVGAAIRF